ncbi:MAG: ATP-binding protein [Firmicutes bacterium]|nr:ATP-binding protein [Bacillota bacterium]
MKRITLIVGHYGSGKTEFSVNLVLDLKKKLDKVAILDMDIANPYFRSRERQAMLVEKGVTVHFNSFGYDITEDLPALTACMKAPLENKEFTVVADVGGDDSGARVLNQFKKYFVDEEDCEMLMVVNANRPETSDLDGAMYHINAISAETGLRVQGLINNTHLLRETTTDEIIKGYRLCEQIKEKTGIPIVWNTCHVSLLDELEERKRLDPSLSGMTIYPITLYMRPTWLDRKVGGLGPKSLI